MDIQLATERRDGYQLAFFQQQLCTEIQWWGLIAFEQVGIDGQRERRRVVPEHP